MASLESLPADQRAVLQLVLQRGRSYDDIARLLSIDRTAVRQRALTALDALGPQTGVPDQRRALITDYLLGQLPERVRDQVRVRLAQSPTERAWARVLASELAPLAAGPFPEIPTEVPDDYPDSPEPPPWDEPPADGSVADEPLVVPSTWTDEPSAASASAPVAATVPAEPRRAPARPAPAPADSRAGAPPGDEPPRPRRAAREPSSRRGGLILIALAVLVAAVVVVLLVSGGSSPKHSAARASASGSGSSSHSTPAPASSTTSGSTTSGSSTAAHVIAQINLTPPTAGSKTAGIAEVLKEGNADGIAIVAQNVPANTARPPNAYAVWLYNSPTDAHILGFVNPGVGANGRLQTAGGLPTNASHFKNLIVTVETAASPKAPGTIILRGTLTGL